MISHNHTTNPDPDKKTVKVGRIEIDRDLCIGAGTCVALAPNTYKLDEEGKAIVLSINGDVDKDIIDGAMSCPTLAIKVYDTDGNQIYP
jgi:ferredoxin